MSSYFYVNGNFVPAEAAVIPALDRGFLFGDGIYEVVAVMDGRLLEFDRHSARLDRSLGEIRMANPLPREVLLETCRELVRRNSLSNGSIYLQVTRGADVKRDFGFPDADVKPTVMMFPSARDWRVNPYAETGVSLASVPDLRWKRRDVKSISLVAQVLAKQAARELGAFEALMLDEDDVVTEGSSSSIFFVNAQNEIVVRPLSQDILPGCTRAAVLQLAAERKMPVVERKFTLQECLQAKEVVLTSALHFVLPVVTIDGQTIGDGRPGEIAPALRALYLEHAVATAI